MSISPFVVTTRTSFGDALARLERDSFKMALAKACSGMGGHPAAVRTPIEELDLTRVENGIPSRNPPIERGELLARDRLGRRIRGRGNAFEDWPVNRRQVFDGRSHHDIRRA
jgi:hypothetical protein